MTNVAFIPVRGGSKSIPLKNIKLLAGQPLVYWAAKAANDADCIDEVVIATDSEQIKDAVEKMNLKKVKIYDRQPQNAQDSSSTESVMLEYLQSEYSKLNDNDFFFLIQATSPLIKSEFIDEMFDKFMATGYDSAFSAVVSKRFFWTKDAEPLNYDYKNRPRRQDFSGFFLENGACYINSVKNILNDKNRLSGKKYIYEMPEYTAYEIDEPDDFLIIEQLLLLHKDN